MILPYCSLVQLSDHKSHKMAQKQKAGDKAGVAQLIQKH